MARARQKTTAATSATGTITTGEPSAVITLATSVSQSLRMSLTRSIAA